MPPYDSCGIDANLCCAGIGPTIGFKSGPIAGQAALPKKAGLADK
jgi:hypothetical protein